MNPHDTFGVTVYRSGSARHRQILASLRRPFEDEKKKAYEPNVLTVISLTKMPDRHFTEAGLAEFWAWQEPWLTAAEEHLCQDEVVDRSISIRLFVDDSGILSGLEWVHDFAHWLICVLTSDAWQHLILDPTGRLSERVAPVKDSETFVIILPAELRLPAFTGLALQLWHDFCQQVEKHSSPWPPTQKARPERHSRAVRRTGSRPPHNSDNRSILAVARR